MSAELKEQAKLKKSLVIKQEDFTTGNNFTLGSVSALFYFSNLAASGCGLVY